MPRQPATMLTPSHRAALGSVGLIVLAACAPERPEDASQAAGAPPGDSIQMTTRAAGQSPAMDELPQACDLLSPAAAAGITGPGNAAGSSPFRSVCRWQAADGNGTLSVVVSSLSMATLDYRAMGEEAFIAAIMSLVAPSYADVRHVPSTEDPGEGAWSFDVDGDAVTWVNTGLAHRVSPGSGQNELFLLVRLSGGDEFDAARAHTLAIASDVRERLSARSEDSRP